MTQRSGLFVVLLLLFGTFGCGRSTADVPIPARMNVAEAPHITTFNAHATGTPAGTALSTLLPSSPAPSTLMPTSFDTGLYPVHLTYVQTSDTLHSPQSKVHRYLQYVSSSNNSLSVVVTPVGGTPMSPVVGSCTTVTCTVNFTANAGPNTLAFKLTDAAGGLGNTLSLFTTMLIVQPIALNTIALTANPVVNSVSLQLASSSVNAGIATDVALTVKALDADGNIIAGSGNYVDANGNPLALTLSTVNTQNGGSGSVSIKGSAHISAPGQAPSYVHYNGQWMTSSAISVTSSQSIPGALSGTSLAITPSVVQQYTPTSGAGYGLTTGPDQNIWLTEWSANKVAKMTLNGVFTEYTPLTASSTPEGIVLGNDGNLWMVEHNVNKIAKMTTAGAFTEYTIPTATSGTQYLIYSPTGKVWFPEVTTNKIGSFDTSKNVFSEYNVPTGSSSPDKIAYGPDGNYWFTESGVAKIGRITESGAITEFAVPSGENPYGIVAGPDGNMWFTEASGSNNIGKITTSGVITEYPLLVTGGLVWDITVGQDGALWFVDASKFKIGRITTGGTLTEYSLPSGALYVTITSGPDGNLWCADDSGKIVSFMY